MFSNFAPLNPVIFFANASPSSNFLAKALAFIVVGIPPLVNGGLNVFSNDCIIFFWLIGIDSWANNLSASLNSGTLFLKEFSNDFFTIVNSLLILALSWLFIKVFMFVIAEYMSFGFCFTTNSGSFMVDLA